MTDDIDLVEKVARALSLAEPRRPLWDSLSDDCRNYWRKEARAALAVAAPVILERAAKVAEANGCYGQCAAAIRNMKDEWK